MNVLLFLLVGTLAGVSMARRMAQRRLAASAIGLSGALLGGFVLGAVGLRGLFGSLLAAAAGAFALLLIVGALRPTP